jgi:hypothetical protein
MKNEKNWSSKKQFIVSKNRVFELSSSRRYSLRPEFQKLVEQKYFAIMKGNFSALAVKYILGKSKHDLPY